MHTHTYKHTHTHTHRETDTHTHSHAHFALSGRLSYSENIKLREELCVWEEAGRPTQWLITTWPLAYEQH